LPLLTIHTSMHMQKQGWTFFLLPVTSSTNFYCEIELICRKTFEFEPISIDTKVKVDSVPYNSGSSILSGIYHLIFGALIILFSIGYGWTRTFLFYFISKRGPKSEILQIWKIHTICIYFWNAQHRHFVFSLI
jgi:hypothetical protein